MRRGVLLVFLVACGGSTATVADGGTDATTPKKDAATTDAGVDGATDTVPLDGRTVISPSGTTLTQVQVCVYQRPDLGCVTSDSTGAFTIGLPANSETGVTLTRGGYASVLVPLVVGDSPLKYTIGVPTAQSRTSIYAPFGATYPDTNNGFVQFAGTLQGQQELGLDGATASLEPKTGTGPFYLDAQGTPAPGAAASSTYSLMFFANVTPGTYVAKLAPITMSCAQNFGGWTTAQLDATKFPVVAGFETHVGLVCAKK